MSNSEIDKNIAITNNAWAVSLVRFNEQGFPEHAFPVLEGQENVPQQLLRYIKLGGAVAKAAAASVLSFLGLLCSVVVGADAIGAGLILN